MLIIGIFGFGVVIGFAITGIMRNIEEMEYMDKEKEMMELLEQKIENVEIGVIKSESSNTDR